MTAALTACSPTAGPSASTSLSDPKPRRNASEAESVPATAIAPASVPVTREPWTFESKPGFVYATPNYRLFTTVQSPLLVSRLPSFMETALAQYRSVLGPLPGPPGPMESYVLATRPQWVRFTQRLLGPQAEAFLKIQRGGFATRGYAVLYDVGMRDTFSLAAHEGWHQYTQRSFRQSLPVWLEEGIATYMEGYRWDQQNAGAAVFWPWANSERFEQLRRAHAAGRLMPVDRLLTTSPQELLAGRLQPSARVFLRPGIDVPGGLLPGMDASVDAIVDAATDDALNFYAQVWAMVHFLREGENGKYREQFAATLADAAAGRLSQRLLEGGGAVGAELATGYMLPRRGMLFLQASMNVEPKTLQREYTAFVDRVVSPGAKERITAGRSPLEP